MNLNAIIVKILSEYRFRNISQTIQLAIRNGVIMCFQTIYMATYGVIC